MKRILFFILLFVGANCLPNKLLTDILAQLNKSNHRIQTSVDQINTSVANNKKYMTDLHNQSSSNSEMFAHKLNEMQEDLIGKTEQLDQKIVSLSEDHQQSASNTEKLQDSVNQLRVEHNETSSTVDQLSSSVAEIMKYMKEEHIETSSMFKTFEQKLDANQKFHYQFKEEILAEDCSDLYDEGLHVSTSYFLQKYNRNVSCDMETDGGGWLVIQKRRKFTNQVDFNTTWASYKEGFGDLDTEFWIGNEFLHRITNQKSYELRIDMKDFEKGTFYATYSEFRVGNEESGYQLHVGGFKGNAQNSLEYQNSMKFTTFDRDNDKWRKNCAKDFFGGFWYNACYNANLNGLYPTAPDRENRKLITWYPGEYLIITNVEMKIRPKQ